MPRGRRRRQGVLDVLATLVGAAGGVEGRAGRVLGVAGHEPVAQPAVQPVGAGDHGQRAGDHGRVAVDPRRVDDAAEAGPVELGRRHRAVLGPVVLLPVEGEDAGGRRGGARRPRRRAGPAPTEVVPARSTLRRPIPVCDRCTWASTKAGRHQRTVEVHDRVHDVGVRGRALLVADPADPPVGRPRGPSRRGGQGCGPARGGRASSPWRHSRSGPGHRCAESSSTASAQRAISPLLVGGHDPHLAGFRRPRCAARPAPAAFAAVVERAARARRARRRRPPAARRCARRSPR